MTRWTTEWMQQLVSSQLSLSNGTPTDGELLIGNGNGFVLGNVTAGAGITVTNGSGSIVVAATGGGASQWTAGTVSALGANLTLTSGTLSASAGTGEWTAGTVSAVGANLTLTSGTLSANAGTSEWTAGTVSAVGANLTLTSGTLSASAGTSQWTAGTVSAVGANLTLTSGTLSANAGTSEWTAGTVSAVSADFSLTGGTMALSAVSLVTIGSNNLVFSTGSTITGVTAVGAVDLIFQGGATVATGTYVLETSLPYPITINDAKTWISGTSPSATGVAVQLTHSGVTTAVGGLNTLSVTTGTPNSPITATASSANTAVAGDTLQVAIGTLSGTITALGIHLDFTRTG